MLRCLISISFWLVLSKICCCFELNARRRRHSSTNQRHSANLRALVWPIRENEQQNGIRIEYRIYISPNKFEFDKSGTRLKMYVGQQRPIRAMLGSQGGMGEFDTPMSGTPANLYIWIQEKKYGKIQRFAIKKPNLFKNYAFDFRDGEVIEYDRVIGVLERLQIKSIFFNANKVLEKRIEQKFATLRRQIFEQLDEILEKKFDKFLNRINTKNTKQKLTKLRDNILDKLQQQLWDELSIFQKKKWIFKLVDG